MNAKAIIKTSKAAIVKHAPGILTGIAIGGVVVSAYLWVTETPKAQERIRKAEEEKGEKLNKKETFKAAAPAYIPAASVSAVTITAMFMAHKISVKQMAALLAAYQLSEDKLAEWKEDTLKTVGQKKTDDIEENIARSRMSKVPITEDGIINTGKGNTLFFDAWSGRYFYSDRQALHEAELNLGDMHVDANDICLNDVYEELLLEYVKKGNEWVFINRPRFKYTAVMHPTLGIACTQIDFVEDPTLMPF